jgi:hypothetical protein
MTDAQDKNFRNFFELPRLCVNKKSIKDNSPNVRTKLSGNNSFLCKLSNKNMLNSSSHLLSNLLTENDKYITSEVKVKNLCRFRPRNVTVTESDCRKVKQTIHLMKNKSEKYFFKSKTSKFPQKEKENLLFNKLSIKYNKTAYSKTESVGNSILNHTTKHFFKSKASFSNIRKSIKIEKSISENFYTNSIDSNQETISTDKFPNISLKNLTFSQMKPFQRNIQLGGDSLTQLEGPKLIKPKGRWNQV